MDKWQAIQKFWGSFGLPAYDENSVPEYITDENGNEVKVEPPYITYSAQTASFEAPILLTASIWYRSQSWEAISKKADEIALNSHKLIKLDDGYLFITQGSPFAQRMNDTDETIKRIYINLMCEFFTSN